MPQHKERQGKRVTIALKLKLIEALKDSQVYDLGDNKEDQISIASNLEVYFLNQKSYYPGGIHILYKNDNGLVINAIAVEDKDALTERYRIIYETTNECH